MRLTTKQYEQLTGKKRQSPPKLTAQVDGAMVRSGYCILVLPMPASRNAEPHHWAACRKIKKRFESDSYGAWLCAGMPKFGNVEIVPVFCFPDGRNRDNDNYVNLATKGILDGLKGNLVRDDNSDLLTLQAPEFVTDREYPRLELHVLEVRS